MRTYKHTLRKTLRTWQLYMLTALSIAGSFGLGIQSSGNVQPIEHTEAGGRIAGDITGDDRVDLGDVIRLLEIVRGYRNATPKELQADPNQDGTLTIEDALRILHDLQLTR